VIRLKYGKPIWQLVAEAADSFEKEIFTASDIVDKVHETRPEVPEISIKSYVIAMAPNHPFVGIGLQRERIIPISTISEMENSGF